MGKCICKDVRFMGILWAIIRIWLGYTWIKAGISKIQNPAWFGSDAGTAISGFFRGALAKATGDNPMVQEWYASFLENVALPNAQAFSYLIVFAEILVGLSLLFGLFTIIGLLAGGFMNLNFLLAGSGSMNPVMITLTFILIYVGYGSYYYGLDRWVLPWLKLKFKRKASEE